MRGVDYIPIPVTFRSPSQKSLSGSECNRDRSIMGIGMQYVTGIRYETENVICNGDQNVICSLHSDPEGDF